MNVLARPLTSTSMSVTPGTVFLMFIEIVNDNLNGLERLSKQESMLLRNSRAIVFFVKAFSGKSNVLEMLLKIKNLMWGWAL